MAKPSTPSQFRFGVLADIQYADVPDKSSHSRQWRRYRGTLGVAERAVAFFNAHNAASPLKFVVHAGDILDHNAAWDFEADAFRPVEDGMAALADVMRVLSASETERWLFTLGNHEMYNFSRQQLRDGVHASGASRPFRCANEDGAFYHSFSPHPRWRVVVLDPYDVSVYRHGRGMGLCEDAVALLCKHNHNAREYVASNPDVFTSEKMSHFPYFDGLEGLNKRWVPFNGGVGDAQLAWLADELAAAAAQEQRVLVFSHLLLHPSTSAGGGKTLLWNYDAVLDVLGASAQRGHPVAAVFSGHQHQGGFHTCEDTGTHFVVLESPLLAEPVDPAASSGAEAGPYAVVDVSENCLRLTGNGLADSPLFRDAKAMLCEASAQRCKVKELALVPNVARL